VDVEVGQCNKGGHRSPCYLILVWDLGKGFEMKSARHNPPPSYLAHVGIGFPNI
jgi:hypothetical protein